MGKTQRVLVTHLCFTKPEAAAMIYGVGLERQKFESILAALAILGPQSMAGLRSMATWDPPVLMSRPSTRALATVLAMTLLCSPAPSTAAPTPRLLPYAACRAHAEVKWPSLADQKDRDLLDRWCDTVGPPVVLNVAPGRTRRVTTLAIVSWNMHVGGGQLDELVAWMRRDPMLGQPEVGIVLLLQEAFRSGSKIPPDPFTSKVPRAIRPDRPTADVMATAHALGMSAVYVPSMRNGTGDTPAEREDRGNAILSTEPLTDIRAVELPFGKQRRVAVMAAIAPRSDTGPPLHLASFHFDTNSDRDTQSAAMATVLGDLARSSTPIVAGGDLNALWGVRDDAFRALNDTVAAEACGTERTNVWPGRLDLLFGWWRGRIDFIFSTLGSSGLARSCRTLADRHGSDHHPVLLLLKLV